MGNSPHKFAFANNKKMLKILKWLGLIVMSLLILLIAATAAMQHKKFDVPYPDIHASTDSAIIRRGRYLVTSVSHCAYCHGDSAKTALLHNGGIISLKGGRVFPIPLGKVHIPNITPDKETGIGNISDGAIARALRNGVGHDGRALIGFMPYQGLSDADLTAIISYLRQQPPVTNAVPHIEPTVLGRVVMAWLLKPTGPRYTPPSNLKPDTTAVYGAYLANNVASCYSCHTARDPKNGQFIGAPFAGGFHMASESDPANYEVITPNLTPDPKTGRLAAFDFHLFQSRFRMGPLTPHTSMPWGAFRNMSDSDLKAIYNYLQQLKPVYNKIDQTVIKKEKP